MNDENTECNNDGNISDRLQELIISETETETATTTTAAATNDHSSSLQRRSLVGEKQTEDDDEPTTSSVVETTRHQQQPIIICDCGYGWPKQKRPRLERIRACSRQICNFIEMQQAQQNNNNKSSGGSYSVPVSISDSSQKCKLIVTSEKEEDIQPLKERILQTLQQQESSNLNYNNDDFLLEFCIMNDSMHSNKKSTDATCNNNDNGVNDKVDDDCCLLSSLLQQQQQQQREKYCNNDTVVVYLSPDATNVLDPSLPPPNIVIIGMLVDRRVTPGRSKSRAEELMKMSMSLISSSSSCTTPTATNSTDHEKFKIAKLPLETTKLDGLDNNEPLNIDTVMEIMQRWWYNYYYNNENLNGISEEKRNKLCFINAATQAMLTHQERHPNRTLHK